MGRRRRFEAEILAQFALRVLAAPHRLRDQFVGQDQSRIRDIFHHQRDIGIFIGAGIIAMQSHRIALDAIEEHFGKRLRASRSTPPLAPSTHTNGHG